MWFVLGQATQMWTPEAKTLPTCDQWRCEMPTSRVLCVRAVNCEMPKAPSACFRSCKKFLVQCTAWDKNGWREEFTGPLQVRRKKSELSLSYTLTFQIFLKWTLLIPFVWFEHLDLKTKAEFQLYADPSFALEANLAWQDGRSASLTAPNGPAQEEMVTRVTPPEEKSGKMWRFPPGRCECPLFPLFEAIKEALMTPPESTVAAWGDVGCYLNVINPINHS